MNIVSIRHAWSEPAGFTIDRPEGTPEYVFLHLYNAVDILVNGSIQLARPGACILYSPETPQWFRSVEPLMHDWMHLSGRVAQEAAQFGFQPDAVYYPRNGRAITELMRDMETESLARKRFSSEICDGKLRELFAKVIRYSEADANVWAIRQDTAYRLGELRATLQREYTACWTIDTMAALVGVSPSRLFLFYKQMFGISPVRDLIMVRIERAKTLLMKTDMSVADIAEAVGYTSVSHFIRQFRSITGYPPGKFRAHFQLGQRVPPI